MFTLTNCSGLDTFGLLQFCDSGLKRFLGVISSSVVGFFDFSSSVSKNLVPPYPPLSFCLNFHSFGVKFLEIDSRNSQKVHRVNSAPSPDPSFPTKIVWSNVSKIHALYSLVQNLNIFGVSLSILG